MDCDIKYVPFCLVSQSYEAALELDATLSHAHVNLGAIFHSRVREFIKAMLCNNDL